MWRVVGRRVEGGPRPALRDKKKKKRISWLVGEYGGMAGGSRRSVRKGSYETPCVKDLAGRYRGRQIE